MGNERIYIEYDGEQCQVMDVRHCFLTLYKPSDKSLFNVGRLGLPEEVRKVVDVYLIPEIPEILYGT